MAAFVLGPDDDGQLHGLVVDLQLGFRVGAFSGTVDPPEAARQHNLYTPPVNLHNPSLRGHSSRRRRRRQVFTSRGARRRPALRRPGRGAPGARPRLAAARAAGAHRRAAPAARRHARLDRGAAPGPGAARARARRLRRALARGALLLLGAATIPAWRASSARAGARTAGTSPSSAIAVNPNDVAGLLLGGRLHGQLRARPRAW